MKPRLPRPTKYFLLHKEIELDRVGVSRKFVSKELKLIEPCPYVTPRLKPLKELTNSLNYPPCLRLLKLKSKKDSQRTNSIKSHVYFKVH